MLHCIVQDGELASSVRIIANEDEKSPIVATEFIAHPRYNPRGRLEAYDVAVAITEQDIPTRAIKIVEESASFAGACGVIAGYGRDDSLEVPGTGSRYLPDHARFGKVQIAYQAQDGIGIEFDYSRDSRPGENSNTCGGDSGGPLVVKSHGEWVLTGVTSNGTFSDCGPVDSSRFTNLASRAVQEFLKEPFTYLVTPVHEPTREEKLALDVHYLCFDVYTNLIEPDYVAHEDYHSDGVIDELDVEALLQQEGFRRGDLNLDGKVDLNDWNQMREFWGGSVTDWGMGDAEYANGNLNCDSVVDAKDASILFSNWTVDF